MKKIAIVLSLLAVSTIAFTQWVTYIEPKAPPPTPREIIQAMTTEQKVAVVVAWESGVSPMEARTTTGQNRAVLEYFWSQFRGIQITADTLQLAYSYSTQTALANAVYNYFNVDFTSGQVAYMVNRRIIWFKEDHAGDFTYYRNNLQFMYGGQ